MIGVMIKIQKKIHRYCSVLAKVLIATHQLRRLKKNRNTIYMVCPFGIGDTLFVASLIKSYKLHYGIKQVCLIVKENQSDLPDFFDSVDNKIVSNHLVASLAFYARWKRCFAKYNFRYGHFILDFGWPEPGQLLGIKNINLIDIYKRCVFNIPLTVPMECPKVFISLKEMEHYKVDFSNENKVLVLMPYAVTVKRLSVELWERVAAYYIEKGYKVYTNIKDASEPVVAGTEALHLSLKELYIVSRTYNWEVIALRSGICDLLGFSDIRMTIIHENLVLQNAWNMSGMGLPNKRMKDIALNLNKTLEENVKYIIENHKEKKELYYGC